MKKFFTLLTLLVGICTGAWAQGWSVNFCDYSSITKQNTTGQTLTKSPVSFQLKYSDSASTFKCTSKATDKHTSLDVSVTDGYTISKVVFTSSDLNSNSKFFVNETAIDWNTTTDIASYTPASATSSISFVYKQNAGTYGNTNNTIFSNVQVYYEKTSLTYPFTATWDFQNCNPSTLSSVSIQSKKDDILSTIAGFYMFANAASGKITYRSANNDAQFNAGTILQIPVNSITDVVTVVPRTVSANWTLGTQTITSATSTNYTAKMRDYDQGYVSLTSGGGYLYSIQVVQNAKPTTPALMKFTTAGGTTFYADELEWTESPSGTFTTSAKQPGTETLVSSSSPLASSVAYVGAIASTSYEGNTATITVTENATTYTYIINFSLMADRTVTYYDVDGTTSLGTQVVTDGDAIGTFAYTANPDAGYSFRDWFTAANGAGTKVTTATVVTGGDMDIYAYQTVTETANDTETYTFDLTTASFNADYHEAFVATNASYHNNHGWLFGTGSTLQLLVGGNSKIIVGLCQFSADGATMTVTYPDASSSSAVPVKSAACGNTYTFTYTGGVAGTATITFPNGAYIPSVQIVNTGAYLTPAKEYTTYVTSKALDFTGLDIKAYVATAAEGSVVTMSPVTTVPANTPLVLKKGSDASYAVPVAVSASAPASNLLVAGDGTTTIGGDGNYDYVLSNGAFHRANEGTVAVGKAYLHLTSAPARELSISFEDEDVTGIQSIENGKSAIDNTVYDLSGRRVAQPTKGLYIVNGKKVVIK